MRYIYFVFYIKKDYSNENNSVAEITIKPRYLRATIYIYQCAFEDHNNVEEIIQHELCHCLTENLYVYCIDFLNGKMHSCDDIEHQRELLTERISKLLRR